MFQPGISGNPAGKPKGAKTERKKIADLFSESEIEDVLRERFQKRDKFVIQFVLEHYYGKAENVNKNTNVNHFPDFIRIVSGPVDNITRDLAKPVDSEVDPNLAESSQVIDNIDQTKQECNLEKVEVGKDAKQSA